MMYFFKSREVFSSDRLKPYRISNLFLDTPKETGFNTSYGANSRSYQSGYLIAFLKRAAAGRRPFCWCSCLSPHALSYLLATVVLSTVDFSRMRSRNPCILKKSSRYRLCPNFNRVENGWIRGRPRAGKNPYGNQGSDRIMNGDGEARAVSDFR
jgi:hypothetical protein